jgi:hypothetical protein
MSGNVRVSGTAFLHGCLCGPQDRQFLAGGASAVRMAPMTSIATFVAVAHQFAYRTGRHALAVRLTQQLNALRGLQPKRGLDLRDDTQRDYDDERAYGWTI